MGITWGIIDYGNKYVCRDREEVIEGWRPLAKLCRRAAGFSVMHGDDRINFRREPVPGRPGHFEAAVTVTRDIAARAQVDALSCGDGTYDMFEQLFDGYEIFVPWRPTKAKIDAPGCSADGLRSEAVDSLHDWMHYKQWYPPKDPDLARLANQLYEAAAVAKRLRMMVRISY